ncbi:MAG: hypothetical protein GY792_32110 [Gammaproteobacteria bacterium]|nr:hypothetical protein [Gammaproteobacteria bacterium]
MSCERLQKSDDVNQPGVRMWLFGMVTLIEMAITRRQLPGRHMAQIQIQNGSLLEWIGIASKRLAKRAAQELGLLRNHLVHSQEIATHDWAQIARMTQRVEELVHL